MRSCLGLVYRSAGVPCRQAGPVAAAASQLLGRCINLPGNETVRDIDGRRRCDCLRCAPYYYSWQALAL